MPHIQTPQKPLIAASSIATLIAASSNTHAAIIYFDTEHALSNNGLHGDVPWDIDGSNGPEAELGLVSSIFFAHSAFGIHTSSSRLQALNYGVGIAQGLQFRGYVTGFVNTGGPAYATGFTDGVPAYVGFTFNPDGTPLYGWAEVVLWSAAAAADHFEDSIENYQFGYIEIKRWAYEDTGAGIEAGVIPEASNAALGLGLLALGAAGLRRGRWLKHAA